MNIFSASYRKSIRIVAATTLVMGCTFGTVALVSGTSSPAEAKKKAVKQEPKKNKGGNSSSRRRGGGGILGFGFGEGINIYIGR
jgi:hypothetical protein